MPSLSATPQNWVLVSLRISSNKYLPDSHIEGALLGPELQLFGNATHYTISSHWQCSGWSFPSTQLYPYNISHQSISDSRTWSTAVQTAWSMNWKHHSMEWTSVRSKPWAFNMLGNLCHDATFQESQITHATCLGAPLMVVRFVWIIWKILVVA